LGLNSIIYNSCLAATGPWRHGQAQLGLMQQMQLRVDTVTVNTQLTCNWDDWPSALELFQQMQCQLVRRDQCPG
jgi:hypothetical protein